MVMATLSVDSFEITIGDMSVLMPYEAVIAITPSVSKSPLMAVAIIIMVVFFIVLRSFHILKRVPLESSRVRVCVRKTVEVHRRRILPVADR